MKLFLYEHITSGALIDHDLPSSLCREGNDMLMAIVQDLIQLSTLDLIILRDFRLDPLPDLILQSTHQIYTIENKACFDNNYLDAINNADMALVIAPETDGILTNIQQQIRANNTHLLASHHKASKITSDKYLCHQLLTARGLSSPTTIKATDWSVKKFNSVTGFIVKPQDGAGCIDTFFFNNSTSLETWLELHANELNNAIVQTYIEGLSISLSLLADNNGIRVLAINQQNIQLKGNKLVFRGSIVNGVNEDDLSLSEASKIATKVHQAIAGLWGFIGIDLIISSHELVIIDINPRLTTSYIGLGQSLNHNPAELLFTMIEEGLSALPTQLPRHAIEVK